MTTNSVLARIEKKVAEYIGTKHAIICSSARNAIRFSLLALEIEHTDEVVIPDFACAILPITVLCTGARPRFCDIDRETCFITPATLKKALGPHTKVAVLIHPLGLPADTSAIMELAEKENISLIEDAAQSLGASLNQKKTGSLGHVGVLSFNKLLNCNLGGAAVTNDGNLANKIRAARAIEERRALLLSLAHILMKATNLNSNKNMRKLLLAEKIITRRAERIFTKKYVQYYGSEKTIDPYIIRMWRDNTLTSPIINQLMAYGETYWHRRKMEDAELLLLHSEFKNLDLYLQDRRRIANEYDKLLEENRIDKVQVLPMSEPSYLRYPILVHAEHKRVRLQKTFKKMGFNVQDYSYQPLHRSPIFAFLNESDSFPNSKYVSEHIMPLPIYYGMSHEIITRIARVVNTDKILH